MKLKLRSIADGEVGKGIVGYNPIISGQLTREEIDLSSKDENRPLQLISKMKFKLSVKIKKKKICSFI